MAKTVGVVYIAAAVWTIVAVKLLASMHSLIFGTRSEESGQEKPLRSFAEALEDDGEQLTAGQIVRKSGLYRVKETGGSNLSA
ncbi:MAG: hypothetical protein OXG37_03280 [Actinomycetia bacterium]|nr:hypothetical protein [Actinomycetes bacterium]